MTGDLTGGFTDDVVELFLALLINKHDQDVQDFLNKPYILSFRYSALI